MTDKIQKDEWPEPNDADRDDLDSLLKPLLDIEPPSVGFKDKLNAKLVLEYEQRKRQRIPSTKSQNEPAEIDGIYSPLQVISADGESHSAGELLDGAIAASKKKTLLRRIIKWGGAAACLLIVVLWWGASPKYSWAEMIQAIENSDWVKVVAELSPESSNEGWLSGDLKIMAVKSTNHVDFENHDARLSFNPADHAVGRQVIVPSNYNSASAKFVRLLLSTVAGKNREAGNVQSSSGAPMQVIVKEESWERGENGNVILKTTLLVGNPATQEVQLRFEIDPKTKLPIRVNVEGADVQKSKIEFTYPTTGPKSIYSMNVPQDYPIVSTTELVARKAVASNAAVVNKVNIMQPKEATKKEPAQVAILDTIKIIEPAPAVRKKVKKTVPPARPTEEMSQRIDEILQSHWKSNSIVPAATSSDEEFMRRAYLDLTGRIPAVSEVHKFLEDTRPTRRSDLLHTLLESYDHASHLAAVWRGFLVPESADPMELARVSTFEAWLTERFNDNVSYDKLVTELLLAEGRVNQGGPLVFYAAAKLKPEEIARQSARAFLGIRMDCTQCHDHFLDSSWKQKDFWGYAAFFSRISQPEGKLENVPTILKVRDVDHGEAKIPNSDEVVAPHFPHDNEPVDLSKGTTRRKQLAEWITAPDNPRFARATVNRVWAQMFGRGIIDPVDDMRDANKPVSQELLDELADYFVRTGFDLRRLYLTIAQSDAYQLSSSSQDDDPKRQTNFAQMNVKCFSAEQLYDCISVATRVSRTGDVSRLSRFDNFSRQSFIDQFKVPPGNSTDYQAGIAQALTMMNGPLTLSATQFQTSGLLRSIIQAPFFTDEKRIETIFLATLSRKPNEREKQAVIGALKDAQSSEQKGQVLGDLLWALLNSAEFTLIH